MRGKLKRFKEIAERPNVICPEKEVYEKMRGNWQKEHFKNDHDIVLEIGCGRGEYTVGLAQVFPDRNFIGIDIKGDRIWVGSTRAMSLELKNAAFLRTQVQFLPKFFDGEEVKEIWITFPDPRPKDRDEKRRLTNSKYFDLYKSVLQKQGWVHFKTDNTDLFNYTLGVLKTRKDVKNLEFTHDLYSSPFNNDHFGIKTKYEEKFHAMGENIKYLKFQFVDSTN
ncbi:tRNA (guanosine(46)-N7)-methyltransferase TrmB [Fulvivirgaceae bacterium BMA10]|uniref:tRNA (guanine-N(7)-)-methyltransferase n=1 Tax=Splendidivirga corallicola TaxID=3051826 RepID=A0ABT8KXP8_9BACT|nr:tRNA (guanosine(46)-N7)-methyltransferase TrmB [Fulvivirgaceae bacterium BMA10]